MMGQGRSLIDGSPLPTWNCKPGSQQCWSWVTFMTVSQEDSWTPAPQSGSFFTSQATYPVFLSGKWPSIYLINRDKAEQTQDVSVLVAVGNLRGMADKGAERWLLRKLCFQSCIRMPYPRTMQWRMLIFTLSTNSLVPFHTQISINVTSLGEPSLKHSAVLDQFPPWISSVCPKCPGFFDVMWFLCKMHS